MTAPHHGTRRGLRSRPYAESTWSIQDNPESILRKPRNSQRAREDTPVRVHPESVVKSIETLFGEEQQGINYISSIEDSDEEASLSLLPDTDPEETFNRSWGYLPPLEEEAVAVIDAIVANPAMAEQLGRIGPEKTMFIEGLLDRNVLLDESQDPDPRMDQIKRLTPEKFVPETSVEKNAHRRLWIQDQAKCNEGSNEALFQRTMMMSMIARHCFIYENDALDFNVEEPWTCPPMPTRAYVNNQPFLTQPKPDLAVCFRRQFLIPDTLWYNLPQATRRLACYESIDESARERVFHFFTIEAKKGNTSTNDNVGKRQSLNNASQALHNMFEFFREAGPKHENNFFTKVRFFSVVASTEGLTIRIHRATRVPADGSGGGLIVANYPLRFVFQVFSRVQKDNDFNRETILKTFENILVGYGENELRSLLSDAAEAIVTKFRKDPSEALKRTTDLDYYRYDQIFLPKSRKQTPAGSVAR